MSNRLFLLNASHLIIDGLFESIPILLSLMVIAFGSSEKETGVIVACIIMSNTFLGLLTAPLSRQFPFFRTVSLIMLLYGSGLLLNTVSPNLYLAGIFFTLAASGHAVFHNIAFTYLASSAERQSLGKKMGAFTAIGDIGRVPFTAFAGFAGTVSMLKIPGWRIVCLAYGLIGVCFAVYLFSISARPTTKTEPAAHATPNHHCPWPSFALLRNRQLRLPIIANILDAFSSDQIFVFLPYLLFAKGIDPKSIGFFALAFSLGSLLGKVICGRMADHFCARTVFILAEATMSILLAILMAGMQITIITSVVFLLGIVTKGTIPVVQTIITEPIQSNDQYNHIFSISNFSRGITGMLTPLLFGFIAASFGIHWIYSMMAIAAVCSIIPIFKMAPLVCERSA